jgi:hypothetical protein
MDKSTCSVDGTVGVLVEAVVVGVAGEDKGGIEARHDAIRRFAAHHVLVGNVGVAQHPILQLVTLELGQLCSRVPR